ncbi:hypothetical protein LSCM1_07049 [Leishmania martiniquensis]|uniref:Uncharacterized protein n=1 Tax=Leishmania martiniquensis TaxID=1580590 RepID=A0A836KW25_9TRYP|nr:hypothetical protein LSCM1_07049 [Leishmania martiniquensis]
MLRIMLQRLAVQRRIAEQLEAVSLDEVLRRMQSSSLTNPARSLEAHFVLATEKRDHDRTAPAAASPNAENLETSSDLLRNALSERLLAEVRRDIGSHFITLDESSLMLANCLRHGLSPRATQQVFALWQRCMHRAASGQSAKASPRTPALVLGMGGSRTGFVDADKGAAALSELALFQSLVRVMEACLDAHDQQQRGLRQSLKRTRLAGPGARALPLGGSIALTLDNLAALVDMVEQFWANFIDHGASTTGLLVQFTALALALTGRASPVAADAEPGGSFVNSVRRLGQLQTDRELLKQRIFSLCDQAILSLCSQGEAAAAAEGSDGTPPHRESPWWYQPQELVRLSQAMRLIEAYEVEQGWGSGHSSGTGSLMGRSSNGEGGGPRRPGSSAARTSRRDTGKTTLGSSNTLRGTPPRRPQTAFASSTARWLPRLPTTWWTTASPRLHGAAAGHRRTEATAWARRRLGAYVTHHALQHTSTSTSRLSAPPPPMPLYAVSAALVSVSLADMDDIFFTVCATASALASTEAVTRFSWWVRDLLFYHHKQRILHDLREMGGLLGIAEACVTYPEGTQTVLAEALKCLQTSAAVLCCSGDTAAASEPDTRSLLWARACEVVGDALALTIVRAEAQRALRVLIRTASQPAASCIVMGKPSSELGRRHWRYGLLVLACLQLQSADGAITPTLRRVIQGLVLSAPFLRDDADRGGLAAVVRALFVFTRLERSHRTTARALDAPPYEPAVPYLLNELARLLSLPAAALDDNVTAAVEACQDRLQPLPQLTSTERQLLRVALQEVTLQSQHEAKRGLVYEPVAIPSGGDADQSEAAGTASEQAPLSLSASLRAGVVGATDGATPFSDRPSGELRVNRDASRWCTEPHQRTQRRSLRASEEPLLLQPEVDMLTRYLCERRSPG